MALSKDWLPTGDHWGLHISKHEVQTGRMIPAGHKIIWHTTEGSGFDGADSTLRKNGDEPHFLIDMKTGHVIQYISLQQYSKSLRHPDGTRDTNRAGCIQIEIVGFANSSPNWTNAQMSRLASLACLIEHRVPLIHRTAPYPFKPGTARATPEGFITATGHMGHMHVPNNDHVDPGAMDIRRLFKLMEDATKLHSQ